jgi:hypothetical protein
MGVNILVPGRSVSNVGYADLSWQKNVPTEELLLVNPRDKTEVYIASEAFRVCEEAIGLVPTVILGDKAPV